MLGCGVEKKKKTDHFNTTQPTAYKGMDVVYGNMGVRKIGQGGWESWKDKASPEWQALDPGHSEQKQESAHWCG